MFSTDLKLTKVVKIKPLLPTMIAVDLSIDQKYFNIDDDYLLSTAQRPTALITENEQEIVVNKSKLTKTITTPALISNDDAADICSIIYLFRN